MASVGKKRLEFDLTGKWGNASDDEVKNYTYDLCFKNNKDINEIEQEFVSLLHALLISE